MSQKSRMDIVPAFPPELEHMIFLHAAWEDRKLITTLVLVAHRVWKWIRAMQYQIVTELYKPGAAKYEYQVNLVTRLPHYSQHVRHLLIQDSAVALPYLSRCPNVQNLALWIKLSNVNLLSMMEALPLQRLSTSMKTLFPFIPIDLTLPIFSRITHLEILDSFMDWPSLDEIVNMPNLTHLAIYRPESRRSEHIPTAKCPKLRVVVLLGVGYSWVEKLFPNEPRVVAFRVIQPSQDWTIGAEGGADFWVLAEAEVEKRRSKLVTVS